MLIFVVSKKIVTSLCMSSPTEHSELGAFKHNVALIASKNVPNHVIYHACRFSYHLQAITNDN